MPSAAHGQTGRADDIARGVGRAGDHAIGVAELSARFVKSRVAITTFLLIVPCEDMEETSGSSTGRDWIVSGLNSHTGGSPFMPSQSSRMRR